MVGKLVPLLPLYFIKKKKKVLFVFLQRGTYCTAPPASQWLRTPPPDQSIFTAGETAGGHSDKTYMAGCDDDFTFSCGSLRVLSSFTHNPGIVSFNELVTLTSLCHPVLARAVSRPVRTHQINKFIITLHKTCTQPHASRSRPTQKVFYRRLQCIVLILKPGTLPLAFWSFFDL